jgi:hypothetical protein
MNAGSERLPLETASGGVEVPDLEPAGPVHEQQGEGDAAGRDVRPQHDPAAVEPVHPDTGERAHEHERHEPARAEQRHAGGASRHLVGPDQQRERRHRGAGLRDELPAPDDEEPGHDAAVCHAGLAAAAVR